MTAYILTIKCPNRKGIVAAVAGELTRAGGDITEAAQFDDPQTALFFMRVAFNLDGDIGPLKSRFGEVAEQFGIDCRLRAAVEKYRVLLLVSRFDHCMGDLLYRTRLGELNIEVVGIIGNHPDTVLKTSIHKDVPYHHLPVTRDTKPAQEAEIRRIVQETGADLVVLARYMQILSDEMSAFLSGRCINIHHSFLPGFKGAKPYHQAYERGVKMIGATSHYVTTDLDEGPIIFQDVEPVSHADSPEDLVVKGRDIERRVLARAVRLHTENRVLLNGSKTVVFNK